MTISKGAALYVKLLVVLVVGLLPPLLIGFAGWPGALGVGHFAVWGAATAAIAGGLRLGIGVTVSIAVAGVIGMVVRDEPLLVALLMTVLGGLYGWWAAAGWGSGAMMVPALVPYLVQEPPPLFSSDPATVDARYLLAFTAVFLVSGIWGAFITSRIASGSKQLKPPTVRLRATIAYGLALGATAGITAAIALDLSPTLHWAWITLTIFLLANPTGSTDHKKIANRLIGSLAGFLLAMLLFALPLGSAVLGVAALLLLTTALTLKVAGTKYWIYVALLTPAVVLLDANTTDGSWVAEQRLGFTLLGAVLAVAVSVAAHAVYRHWLATHGEQTAAAAANSDQ